MKERHDVEAAVGASERNARGDVRRGRADVALRERHDLRARRRARRVQHERDVIGRGVSAARARRFRAAIDRKQTRGPACVERKRRDVDAELGGDGERRRFRARLDDEQSRLEVSQIKAKLVRTVGGVQRRRRRRGADRDERARHLGPIWQHDRNGVVAPDAELVEPRHRPRHVAAQLSICQRRSPRCAERGIFVGAELEKLVNRFWRHRA